jgi:hypothetical protein
MEKIMTIKELMKRAYATAKDKGWYETAKSPVETHMLICSEIAEAVEEVRKGTPPTYTNDLEWMAGCFDGEGTVGITKAKHYRNGKPVSGHYTLRVSVGNTEPELLQPFLKYGGKLTERVPTNKNAAKCYVWTVHAKKAAPFLKDILPHVKSPKKYWAAFYGLAFDSVRTNFGGKGRGNKPDFENRRRCEAFYNMLKEINTRGAEKPYKLLPIPRKPEGELVELADAVIRIADYCESKGWDLEKALQLKMNYNDTRPFRHGGKKY